MKIFLIINLAWESSGFELKMVEELMEHPSPGVLDELICKQY